MSIEWNEISTKSQGGTEAMGRRIEKSLPKELLDEFQIILTRVGELNPDKYRILYIHDLAEDPSVSHLANDGWKKFHRIVFVSNWQMQQFISKFNIPWSKCIVLQNAIDPLQLPESKKDDGKIKLVYHTTPHRGLNILLATFDKLVQKHENLELHLFSSFELYGWKDRDEQFKPLFDFANTHPNILNHGTCTNDIVRETLADCHIFAYPSIWQETSCICLIEAMSAGLQCVHSNLGALYETASNWTTMYQFNEDTNKHAEVFYHILDNAIRIANNDQTKYRLQSQKSYTDVFYNWEIRALYWKSFLESIVESKEEKALPKGEFIYRI